MNNMVCIEKLSIMNFMVEVHSNWLSDGWKRYVEQGILNTPQGDTPFWDWLQTYPVDECDDHWHLCGDGQGGTVHIYQSKDE